MITNTWTDLIILLLFIAFIYIRARTTNATSGIIGLVSILFSFVVGLAFYLPLASLFSIVLPLSPGFINVLALCTILALTNFLALKLMYRTQKEFLVAAELTWEKYARVIVAGFTGLILFAFFFALALSLPIHPWLKNEITKSVIANSLLQQTQEVEIAIQDSFGRASYETLNFLTIKPIKEIATDIGITYMHSKDNPRAVGTLMPDRASELEMLRLVANARLEHGLTLLTVRPELTEAAREHAADQWRRNYFGHISPDGESPIGRLHKANIPFNVVGENVALAASAEIVEIGLINSDEHRANILDPNYNNIGIGVIDNGTQGKIFVQIFTY